MSFSEWKTYKLNDALEALIDYRGKTPKKTTFGVPLVTAKIVKNGFIEKPNEFIAEEDYDSWMVRGFPKVGDVVLTTEAPLGEVAQIKDARIALAQRIVTLRGKKGLLDNSYLKYFLFSKIGQHRLKERETGTTVSGIKQSELRLVEIDCPPYETQIIIGNILSSLDDAIELNQQINKTLEEMAKVIFKEWFVDFNFPNATGKFQETEIGKIPVGWKVGKLGDIYKTTSGGTPSRAKFEYYENGIYQWVKSKELNNSFIIDTEEKITADALKKSSAKLLSKYSVMIAMYGATVGEIGIISNEATCNQAICAFLPNNDYPFSFIYQFLLLNKQDIISQAVGSAQQNISQQLLLNYALAIPPSETVQAFHKIVEPLFFQIEHCIKENQTLINLRDTLLPKLMKGGFTLNRT
jgi:type I restriction enzyme S subunit